MSEWDGYLGTGRKGGEKREYEHRHAGNEPESGAR